MSDTKEIILKKLRKFRMLRRVLFALTIILVPCALLIAALPGLLSSNYVRQQVVAQIASATGKPTTLDALSFSWSDGLRLKALQVGQGEINDPDFLVKLEDAHADFSLLAALHGTVQLDASVQGLRLRVASGDPTQPAPPAKPLPEALQEMFASLRTGLKPVPFRVHGRMRVDVADAAIRLEPPHGGQPLEFRDLWFTLDAPDLKSAPVVIKAALDVFVDDRRLGPVRLDASFKDFTDTAGHLAPASARLTAKMDAPGLALAASGSLVSSLKVDLLVQLPEALAPAKALAAEALPDLTGALTLGLTLTQITPDRLAVGLVFFADALSASHGPLGDKTIGPLSLNLLQEAELDLKAETVRLPGSLNLRPTSHAAWLAELEGVAKGKPRLTISIKPLHLAVGELLPAVRAFLPPGVSLGSAVLDAENTRLALQILPPGVEQSLEAQVTGLVLSANTIAQRDATGTLTIAAADLHVPSASVILRGAEPGTLQAELTATLKNLRRAGAKNNSGKPLLAVREATLPRLLLRVEDFKQNAEALFGVTGQVRLEQEAQVKDIEAKGKAFVPVLTEQTRLRLDLPKAKTATVTLEALDIDVPLLRVLQHGKKPLEAPLSLHASAGTLALSGPAPITPALHALNLNLVLGEALSATATMSLTGQTGQDLRGEGRISLDAQKLLALSAPFAPRQAKASGGLSMNWKLSATLPRTQQSPNTTAKAPLATPKKLSQSIKELHFVREAEAELKLNALSLDWPLPATPGKPVETLHLRGLSTPQPLLLTTKNGLGESHLTGSLAFGPMDALPGLGRLSKPFSGRMTLTATQQGMRSVQCAEVLHLDGLELDQNLSLTFDKLDTVLDRDADRLAAALELMDANISFNLSTGLLALSNATATKATDNKSGSLSGKGRLEAGAEVRLSGGRSLALSARLFSPGLDLRLGPDMAITGLTSNLSFKRSFSLSPGLRCPGDVESERQPLSEQVFDLFPASRAPRTANRSSGEALGQLLRAETAGAKDSTFSLTQLKLKSGGLPLDIRDVELRLDTRGAVPGLRSFRAGLLGGNIMGSAMIRKNAGRYTLDTDFAFTGIDPARLLPAKAPKDLGSQSEAAGRVSLSAPLTPDPEVLLQQLDFRADITKIGPRTLERMLYALDPDEQNETIVQQRRLMDIGYPRFLRVAAAYGNLSLSGAVDVKGFQLDLPQLDRLNIANLPLRQQLAKPLASVSGLIKLLDAASGSHLCRNPADAKGSLRVVQP